MGLSFLFTLKKVGWQVNKIILAASKDQPLAVTMWEKPTLHLMESLVRNGRSLYRMDIITPTWEIIISVGIPMALPNPRCGVIPRTQKLKNSIAQFHSAPL